MEAAGLATAVLALAGLFNNAVDCFEYVQIGKAFEQDLDTCLLRLATARLKLSRWGYAVGLERVADQQSTSHVRYSLEEVKIAQDLMQQIVDLFKTAEKTSDRLLKRPNSTQLALVAPDAIAQSRMGQLTSIMRNISIKRTSKTGLAMKTKWALYQRGQFLGLIENISDLVNELIDLFPAAKVTRPALYLEEATEFCNDTTITSQVNELQRVAEESDPDLATAIETALQQRGHSLQTTHYNNVNMSGTFYGQTQNIGVSYGGANFESKTRDGVTRSVLKASATVWPHLPIPNAPRSALAPTITVTGHFEDSNVIGYVNNLTVASDPLPRSAWTVPRAVNSLFVGRQDTATILGKAFAGTHQPTEQKPKTFVIIGLGGMGKSEVSIKYAFDNKIKYWGVFWIDCQNEATAQESFELIGGKCRILRPTIKSVKAWLCSTDKQWLLIIDNADDPKQDYNQYLPATGNGHVIITTRLQECERYQNVGSTNLDILAAPAARELLFNSARIDPEHRRYQEDSADQALEKLSFHTLAIIHAGSYIKKSYCSIPEYLEIFAKHRKSIFNTPLGQEESTYKTVFATFEASAERLESLRQSTKVEAISRVQAGDALELLHIMAFMHNIGNYEIIFSRARTFASALQSGSIDVKQDIVDNLSAHHVALLPAFFPSEERNIELQIRWRQAYNTLHAFSFVTITKEDRSISLSIHQLVHIWAKERQNVEQQRVYWQAAASAICSACPTQRVNVLWTPSGHSFTPVVQEHARACAALVTNKLIESPPPLPVLQLLFHLAWLNFESGKSVAFENAWSLLKHMRNFATERTGENEISYRELQGHLFWEQGHETEAIIEFKASLELAQAYDWGEERTLRIQRNLARIYQLNQQHDKALEVLQHIQEVQRTLKQDHADRLGSLRLLAELHTDFGQVDKAIPLLEFIVTGKNQFVRDHTEFFWARLDLATAYKAKGQSYKSVKILEPILELTGAEEVKFAAKLLLKPAYIANGQIDKVITILEHAIMLEKNASLNGPSQYRLWSCSQIAYEGYNMVTEAVYAYFVDHQNERSQILLEHIIDKSHKKFSPSKYAQRHPTVYKYETLLARIYLTQCNYADAIYVLEGLAVVEVLSDDWEHQFRVDIRWLLAKAYVATGRRREASLCLEHILSVQNAHWAGQVHRKFPVLVDIADDLRAEGSFDKAIVQYDTVASILEDSKYERDILLRLNVRCKLGMAYMHAGRVNKALDSLWTDFSYEIACLPADHPTQLATQYAYIQAFNAVNGTSIVPEFTPEVNYGW